MKEQKLSSTDIFGAVKTAKSAKSSRENGKKGGRPKKVIKEKKS